MADFIIKEMRTNVASKEAKEIKDMLEIERTLIKQSPVNAIGLFTPAGKAFAMSSKIQSLWKFREIIDTNKPWDHKPQIWDLYPTMGLSTPFYHRYIHNGKYYEISYNIWSNIHFGYIGKAIGFWEWLLKKGADWAKNGFFGDDPKDKAAIDIGYQLYDTYKENLLRFTAEQLLDIILKNKHNLNVKEVNND